MTDPFSFFSMFDEPGPMCRFVAMRGGGRHSLDQRAGGGAIQCVREVFNVHVDGTRCTRCTRCVTSNTIL